MEVKRISPQVLAAATGLLQPFIPEISAENLVTALKNFAIRKQDSIITERLLTRKEASNLLSISIQTLDRYIKSGILRSSKIGPRSVRIDPASVRELLAGGIENE